MSSFAVPTVQRFRLCSNDQLPITRALCSAERQTRRLSLAKRQQSWVVSTSEKQPIRFPGPTGAQFGRNTLQFFSPWWLSCLHNVFNYASRIPARAVRLTSAQVEAANRGVRVCFFLRGCSVVRPRSDGELGIDVRRRGILARTQLEHFSR